MKRDYRYNIARSTNGYVIRKSWDILNPAGNTDYRDEQTNFADWSAVAKYISENELPADTEE